MHPDSHAQTLMCPLTYFSLCPVSCVTDRGTLKLAKSHHPHLYRCCIHGHSRKSAHSLIIFIISFPHCIIHQANPALPIIYRLPAKCTIPAHRCKLTRGLTAICLYISPQRLIFALHAGSKYFLKCSNHLSLSNRATVCRIYWFFKDRHFFFRAVWAAIVITFAFGVLVVRFSFQRYMLPYI